MTDIKLTHDRVAAVNNKVLWLCVKEFPPPIGPKIQLIDRGAGVAVYGKYSPNSTFTHWQALPRFKD